MPVDLPTIRVAPGGRYFEAGDQPFLFIGANDAIPWVGLAPLYRRRDLPAVRAYLANLAASGVTILRVMLEYAHGNRRYFENRPGVFNPAMVRLWDDLFALCAEVGIRILLTPWDTFWMARRWRFHPYNTVNGGIAESPGDFFTSEPVIAAMENRLRFAAERWGGCGALGAWELFNEIDPLLGGTPQEQGAVIGRLSEVIRTSEWETWGVRRLQTVSVSGGLPSPEYGEMVFRHPALDFAIIPIYGGAIDLRRGTAALALAMAETVRAALRQTPPNRPFLDSEHGTVHLLNNRRRLLPEAIEDEYERRLIWAHLASGGAGSGLRWHPRPPQILTPGMRAALHSLSQFAGWIDWRHFAPTDARPAIAGIPGVQHFAIADKRQAVLFLMRDIGHESARPIRLQMTGLAPAAYHLYLWNTQSGECAGEASVMADASGLQTTLFLPDGDTAIAIRPEPTGEGK